MTHPASQSSSYLLGYDEAEHQRLERQAARWEPATREALEVIGVGPGWRCLDVACGTGAVMRLLSQLVGPSGQVHAIDLDATYGARAADTLNAEIGPIHSFERLDVTAPGTPQGAPFDLVFTRLLICHMTDPIGTVRRLWSWVKPGGTLLLQDYDMGLMQTQPPNPAFDRAFQLLQAPFTASGRDPRAGASMQHYLAAAGAGFPDDTRIAGWLSPRPVGVAALVSVLASLVPALAELQMATAAEVAEVIARLRAAAEEPHATMRGPDLISCWKRKEA